MKTYLRHTVVHNCSHMFFHPHRIQDQQRLGKYNFLEVLGWVEMGD